MTPPQSCLVDGCRFSGGYAPGVVFAAPAGAQNVPSMLVFASDAAVGYPHYGKHFPWLTGSAVVEQLRMAWRSARHTVLAGREHRLFWVVDHDAFEATFEGARLTLVIKACSSYVPGIRCCTGCHERHLPDGMTLRSIMRWQQMKLTRVLYTDVTEVGVAEYLSDQPDSLIGLQFPIAGEPAFRKPYPNRFSYDVPVVIGGAHKVTRVVASPPQRALIEADEACFVRTHDVTFISRLANGMMRAEFVRRDEPPPERGS